MKHLKLFENFNSEITFEILDYNVDYDIINENFNYHKYEYDDYDNEGKKETYLSTEQVTKLNEIETELRYYLDDINKFQGNYLHRNGANIKKFFTIKLTKHYIEKFLRGDMENIGGTKGFLNPGTYEGIDFIYNNRDVLTSYLFSGILKDEDNVLVIMKSTSGYKVIVIIQQIDKKNYNLILKTQMKGKASYNKKHSDKVIKLFPDPTKKPS